MVKIKPQLFQIQFPKQIEIYGDSIIIFLLFVLFFFPSKILPLIVLSMVALLLYFNRGSIKLISNLYFPFLTLALIFSIGVSALLNGSPINTLIYYSYFLISPFLATIILSNLRKEKLRLLVDVIYYFTIVQFFYIPISYLIHKRGSDTDDWFSGTIATRGVNQDVTAYVMAMTALFFFALPKGFFPQKKIAGILAVMSWICTNTFKTYPLFIIALLVAALIYYRRFYFSPKILTLTAGVFSFAIIFFYQIAHRSMNNLVEIFISGSFLFIGKVGGIFYTFLNFFKLELTTLFGYGPGRVASRVALFKDWYVSKLPELDKNLSIRYYELKQLVTPGDSSIDTPFSSFTAITWELGVMGLVIYCLYFVKFFSLFSEASLNIAKSLKFSGAILFFFFFISCILENNIDHSKTHTFFITYFILLILIFRAYDVKKIL